MIDKLSRTNHQMWWAQVLSTPREAQLVSFISATTQAPVVVILFRVLLSITESSPVSAATTSCFTSPVLVAAFRPATQSLLEP
jgi:hypothetical protein